MVLRIHIYMYKLLKALKKTWLAMEREALRIPGRGALSLASPASARGFAVCMTSAVVDADAKAVALACG